ncbi:MAG: mechanosensitive ion channel domain-containing protein [Pseudomonadota bacterium]
MSGSRFVALLAAALVAATLVLFTHPIPAAAQEDAEPAPVVEEFETAPVEIDGEAFFVVRGARSFTAEERADYIEEQIIRAAEKHPDFEPEVEVRRSEFGPAIYADGEYISVVTDADAEMEGLNVDLLADVISGEVAKAIKAYRKGRTSTAVQAGLIDTLVWTAALIILLVSLFFFRRYVRHRIERHVDKWVLSLEESTGRLIDARSLLAIQRSLFRGIYTFILAIVGYLYVSLVLREFAVTSWLASLLLDTIGAPLIALGEAALAEIPDLITLIVIILISRYFLKLLRLFFENVENGIIKFADFDPDWVWPTHRICRVLFIIISVIIAYPYIPGSGTEAFQGMTIFLGILVTLSSNSIASNLLAGLFVIYKRSVNIGDRIRVGDVIGNVEQVSLLDTHLRTLKNELLSVPNSKLIGDSVTNYTRIAGTSGLIVHATVGIGYDEPADKVEQLLLDAASATKGLKTTPKPFVLKTQLGSHDVSYEINAYAKVGFDPIDIRSELNTHVLDSFNAADVQIMTPFYVSDPSEPKIPRAATTNDLVEKPT